MGGEEKLCRSLIPFFVPAFSRRAIILFFLFSSSFSAAAQTIWTSPEDSLEVERLIQLYGPGDLITNARRALRARLRDADAAAVSSLLFFMPNRQGGSLWLSPEEELLVRTLIADLSFIRDRERFIALLSARVSQPGDKGAYNDNLLNSLREALRSNSGSLFEGVEGAEGEEVEKVFFQLLVNVQQVTGVRKVGEANAMVDRFVAAFSASWYAEAADRYLRLGRLPARIGAGFVLGYAYGGMLGSDIPGRSDGPTIGGELYLKNWTATGELMLGRLELSDSFAVRGRTWEAGDAVLLGGTLGVGYEFRTGDGLITPVAGGAFFTLQEEASQASAEAEQSTGLRVGLALGTIVTYRIPFDYGPHLDLRLRAMAIFPGFSRYSSALDGNLLLVGASFAFAARPYRVGPVLNEEEKK